MHYNGYSCPGTEAIYIQNRQTETKIIHAVFFIVITFSTARYVLREGSPHYAMHITSIDVSWLSIKRGSTVHVLALLAPAAVPHRGVQVCLLWPRGQ